jgi:hypothetical protein
MSLPSGQQRALDHIEKTLADDHPGLGPLFAGFTRLTGHEAVPVTVSQPSELVGKNDRRSARSRTWRCPGPSSRRASRLALDRRHLSRLGRPIDE